MKTLTFYTTTRLLFGGGPSPGPNCLDFFVERSKDSAAEQEHEASKAYEPPNCMIYCDVGRLNFMKRNMDEL